MVLDYYKLREQPFGVTPDSRYLYASNTHREALASLLYGVEKGRGFIALIAKPGMGKTTLLYSALRQIQDRARTAFLFQTIGTPEDFLRALLQDLGAEASAGSLIDLQAKLNAVLVEQSRLGKPLVIIVDEAQHLDGSVLELLRMLSNFETSQAKLLQIVLSGQPQLAEKLASPELVQLRQRISIVARLSPFSPPETALYIDHRLRLAGFSGSAPLFTSDALALIAEHSEGIPRNINNLCFNALSLGCALKKATIDGAIVSEVIGDLELEPLQGKTPAPPPASRASACAEASLFAPALEQPRVHRRFRTIAFALTFLLFLSGALFIRQLLTRNREMLPEASVQAASIEPAATPTDLPSLQLLQDDQTAALTTPSRPAPSDAGVVRVAPGQTLYQICANSFGRCDGKLLQTIQRLNPRLRSLNHLEPGWTIRIPTSRQIASRQTGAALLPQKGTP